MKKALQYCIHIFDFDKQIFLFNFSPHQGAIEMRAMPCLGSFNIRIFLSS